MVILTLCYFIIRMWDFKKVHQEKVSLLKRENLQWKINFLNFPIYYSTIIEIRINNIIVTKQSKKEHFKTKNIAFTPIKAMKIHLLTLFYHPEKIWYQKVWNKNLSFSKNKIIHNSKTWLFNHKKVVNQMIMIMMIFSSAFKILRLNLKRSLLLRGIVIIYKSLLMQLKIHLIWLKQKGT